VVAGPTFASIGLPPIQVGSNHANPNEVIRVYDGAPGLQFYGADDEDPNDKAAQKKHQAATTAAKATAAKKKTKAASKPKQKPATKTKPKTKPKSGGGTGTSSTSSTSSGGSKLDDGAVQGGSFWGDVALFATAIFALELLIYSAIELGLFCWPARWRRR
jgi:hypothetical protein